MVLTGSVLVYQEREIVMRRRRREPDAAGSSRLETLRAPTDAATVEDALPFGVNAAAGKRIAHVTWGIACDRQPGAEARLAVAIEGTLRRPNRCFAKSAKQPAR